jgi:carbamoyl-phosphate synthase large subunit
LLDRYLKGAIEIDVDALCDGNDVYVAGIMEHIEEAGIHSGDSACVLPPHSLPYKTVREIEKQKLSSLAKALKVKGLMNIQFALKRNATPANTIFISSRSTRAPAAPCRSSPKPPACRLPKSPRASWPGEKLSLFR